MSLTHYLPIGISTHYLTSHRYLHTLLPIGISTHYLTSHRYLHTLLPIGIPTHYLTSHRYLHTLLPIGIPTHYLTSHRYLHTLLPIGIPTHYLTSHRYLHTLLPIGIPTHYLPIGIPTHYLPLGIPTHYLPIGIPIHYLPSPYRYPHTLPPYKYLPHRLTIMVPHLDHGCFCFLSSSWEVCPVDKHITIGSSSQYKLIIKCCGYMCDGTIVVVMDIERPVRGEVNKGMRSGSGMNTNTPIFCSSQEIFSRGAKGDKTIFSM